MSIRARVASVVSNWFNGKYIPPDNPPGSMVVFVSGHYERHWTARAVGAIGRFIATEWKWLLGFMVAVAAVVANILVKL